MRQPPRIERIGHRGAPRELSENTLASFERALERGADALELDIHATSDGVVVVHHDAALGAGVEPRELRGAPIAQTAWSVLSTAEVAPGERIPALAEVFASVARRATIYVEIKGRNIEPAVANAILQADTSCAVHSFDHDAIARMRVLAAKVPRGLLFDRYPSAIPEAMAHADARDVWPRWSLIDRPLVDAVHKAGGRVIAWTVNDHDAATRLVEIGVDGICSDDLRQIL